MWIIGCDFHPRFQQIAMVNTEGGKWVERRLWASPTRFGNSKQLASYLGLIPAEDSSGGKQRLGHLSKQGNAQLRGLLHANRIRSAARSRAANPHPPDNADLLIHGEKV